MVFFGEDFITVKKEKNLHWDRFKTWNYFRNKSIFIQSGNEVVVKKRFSITSKPMTEPSDQSNDLVIDKINEVLDSKVRPAVARDGGDITFKTFKNGSGYR